MKIDGPAAGTAPPQAHQASHTDGTDDIQSATNSQKGLATAAQITTLEAASPLGSPTTGSLTDNEGTGEVLKDGTGTTVKGKLYYMTASGAWALTDASAVATSGGVLVGLAVGTDPAVDGMFMRGAFDATLALGTHDQGKAVYISETAGELTITAPSAASAARRIVGHCLATANEIWFNPDGAFLELEA